MRSEHSNRSFENEKAIKTAELVGCYFCLRIQKSTKIKEYCKDKNGKTAICTCGIDSVIPYDEKIDGNLDQFKTYLEECRELSFNYKNGVDQDLE